MLDLSLADYQKYADQVIAGYEEAARFLYGQKIQTAKAINALLRKHGTINFAAGEALAEINLFNDLIDSHHVFPVAYCKKQGIAKERYNSLVNITPLSRLSNQKIGGKASVGGGWMRFCDHT